MIGGWEETGEEDMRGEISGGGEDKDSNEDVVFTTTEVNEMKDTEKDKD